MSECWSLPNWLINEESGNIQANHSKSCCFAFKVAHDKIFFLWITGVNTHQSVRLHAQLSRATVIAQLGHIWEYSLFSWCYWTQTRDPAHFTEWTQFYLELLHFEWFWEVRGLDFPKPFLIGRCLFKFYQREWSLHCQGVFRLLWSVCGKKHDYWNPKMSPQAAK